MPSSSMQMSNLKKPDHLTPELARLWDRVSEAYAWHNSGCHRWSFWFTWVFGASTLISTLTGFLSTASLEPLRIPPNVKDLTIGGFSLLAAMLTAFGAFYGLERKWHANRIARSRLWLLFTDIEIGNPAADISKKLARIIEDEDNTFLGESFASADNEAASRSVAKAPSADGQH